MTPGANRDGNCGCTGPPRNATWLWPFAWIQRTAPRHLGNVNFILPCIPWVLRALNAATAWAEERVFCPLKAGLIPAGWLCLAMCPMVQAQGRGRVATSAPSGLAQHPWLFCWLPSDSCFGQAAPRRGMAL